MLLLFMMLYAACGLVLSFVLHLTSFTAFQAGDSAFAVLFWGIFPVFFSVILIGSSEKKKKMGWATHEETDYWELLLGGCPTLLKQVFWACFYYSIILGIALGALEELNLAWRSASPSGATVLCMAFYAMGLAVFTAAYLRRRGSPI